MRDSDLKEVAGNDGRDWQLPGDAGAEHAGIDAVITDREQIQADDRLGTSRPKGSKDAITDWSPRPKAICAYGSRAVCAYLLLRLLNSTADRQDSGVHDRLKALAGQAA